MPVELHVDDGAHNLADLADFIGSHLRFLRPRLSFHVVPKLFPGSHQSARSGVGGCGDPGHKARDDGGALSVAATIL